MFVAKGEDRKKWWVVWKNTFVSHSDLKLFLEVIMSPPRLVVVFFINHQSEKLAILYQVLSRNVLEKCSTVRTKSETFMTRNCKLWILAKWLLKEVHIKKKNVDIFPAEPAKMEAHTKNDTWKVRVYTAMQHSSAFLSHLSFSSLHSSKER